MLWKGRERKSAKEKTYTIHYVEDVDDVGGVLSLWCRCAVEVCVHALKSTLIVYKGNMAQNHPMRYYYLS